MAKTTPSEKLLRDLQTVVEDAEALLQATAAQTGERIDTIRTRARESLKQAKTRLVEAEGEAMEQVREVATSTDEYVHENPWQAVGVAAGAGLLLGLLISRR
ncbi:MAG: DUF883 family protein [Gammaproteobacteria bacterium]|nr:DUF883 family protein [Gammaproteobacteria bacterium]